MTSRGCQRGPHPNHRHRCSSLRRSSAASSPTAGRAAVSPTPPPPTPAPTPTPDPHLSAPVSVDLLYSKLKKAGLTLYTNTADAGQDGEPRKRLNLTYEGWPLTIAAYSSSEALIRSTGFDPAIRPGDGDPPYTVVGENILVQYGPTVVNRPPEAPEPRWAAAAAKLVGAARSVARSAPAALARAARDRHPDPGAHGRPDPDPDTQGDEEAEADEEAQADEEALSPAASRPAVRPSVGMGASEPVC